MKLQKPTVGPIIGYTTPTQTRMLIRGLPERDGAGFRRCFGVVRWRPVGSEKWSEPVFNKLSPNFDMTGILVLDKLKPETDYEYQAGWFFAESELDKIQSLASTQIEWPAEMLGFRSGTSNQNAVRSYVVGSCRYLLRLFGGTFFDDRGDKAFRSVLEQIDKAKLPVDALLMVGDQIYADDLNFVAADARIDQYLDRYRTVFSQEHIARLMSRVPTYMILDDHEIEDNWPAKATPKDRITVYPNAIHAYQIYQCSHGPLFEATKDGRVDGTLSHFWYDFVDGCAEWFVLDTRTERRLGTAPQMINDKQMKALCAWLKNGSGKVKFVVTSVPLFPDLSSDSQDKWGAFPKQRAEILDHIRNHAVSKVVFVSGDVHCSFVTELTHSADPNFKVHSIVSSSFFWPYPHTELSDFRFGKPLTETGDQTYTSKRLTKVFSTDNFARIEASPTSVTVTYYERKGDRLGPPLLIAL